jgi:predicted RNA binding protein YcfA (HicA-like mRNA interferase family)
MEVSELIAALQTDGWETIRDSAGCTVLKHRSKAPLLSIAAKPSDRLGAVTAQSILRQAGLALKS